MARTTLEMFIKIVGANKVAKALDNVSDELKDLQRQTSKTTKDNAKFSAGMSGLGKTAVAGGAIFAAKSLADFSMAAIQAASSAQEAAGAFGTTFGNAAEQLNKQLAENANLFGLTTAEAQQLISVFGSVAQGIGFTQEQSADLSSELFNLAGDIASFNNITAGAAPVLQAFRSALVGEREALKTYGIAITEAEVQTMAFAQTGKVSADELTRQEKALATTALIFERSSVQQGNAAREAAGFAAQTLIARSATQELKEELGEALRLKYSDDEKLSFLLILQLAVASGNSARINYVAQLANWIDEGQTILYGVQDLVDSVTTEAEVDSIEMDLQSWLSSDPQVVIRTAKGIE